MASLSELKNKIHIAPCADLESLKDQVDEYIIENPGLINYAIEHPYREYNRRKFYLCAGDGMITPYDAGFRPTSYTPSTGGSYILLEDNTEILLENGDNLLLE